MTEPREFLASEAPPPSPGRTWRRVGVATLVAAVLAVVGFAVLPTAGASTVTSIFANDVRPALAADTDHASVELGVKFSPQISGRVTAIKYFQGSAALDVSRATLWAADGSVLARTSFSTSDRIGWRTVPLDKPVDLTVGKTYVASYHADRGAYPSIGRDLASGRTQNGFRLPANAGVYKYGSASDFPTSTYSGANYLADVVYESDEPIAPTPTATAPPQPAPSAPQASATATTGGTKVLGRTFPSAANTGVPAGTTLSTYTGPCTIQTDDVVIDAKTVNCDLRILAQGIKITRSVVNGTIYSDPQYFNGSFTVTDSEIRAPQAAATGIGDANFVATRVEVTGGSRSINCYLNCTVQQSFVHGQYTDKRGIDHESGIRMGSGSVLRGNTIGCTAPDVPPDAGCSAAITGYGDFDTVEKNTIEGNLILAGSGGYCVYGGSTTGKPFSAGVNNIKFIDNIWQRGTSMGDGGRGYVCGWWGPITSFDSHAPGNVWSNNLYDDGTPVPPAN